MGVAAKQLRPDVRRWEDLPALALGLLLVGISFQTPWLHNRMLRNAQDFQGSDLFPFSFAIAMLFVLFAVLAVSKIHFPLFNVLSNGVAAIGIIWIWTMFAFFEMAEALASSFAPSWLPDTLRDITASVVPRWGLLLSALGAGIVVASAHPGAKESIRQFRKFGRLIITRDKRAWSVGLVVCALALGVTARYLTWFHLRIGTGSQSIPLWGIPWISQIGLVAIGGAFVAIVAHVIRRHILAGIVLCVAGWMMTLLGASCVIVGDTPAVTLPAGISSNISKLQEKSDLLLGSARDEPRSANYRLQVDSGIGGSAEFVAGVFMLMASLAYLADLNRESRGRS